LTIENKKTILRCFCIQHSCEATYDKLDNPVEIDGVMVEHVVSTTERYSFIKEDGVICGGGIVSGDIPNCRKSREHYFYNTVADLKKAQNEEKNKNPKKKN